jgi:NADH-quinone oxidoreductase subunit E
MTPAVDMIKVEAILSRYPRGEAAHAIHLLQDIQDNFAYLPAEALRAAADHLGTGLPRVYQMATFFEAFHLEPRGKHICTVCMGTACHVRGAPKLVDQLERDLKVKSGGTTSDMMFTVEEVNCVGACALGPLVIIDGEYHGNMTTNSLSKVITSMKGDVQGGE